MKICKRSVHTNTYTTAVVMYVICIGILGLLAMASLRKHLQILSHYGDNNNNDNSSV